MLTEREYYVVAMVDELFKHDDNNDGYFTFPELFKAYESYKV